MKLNIKFGDITERMITWPKSIHDFPKIIKYLGKKWQSFMYSGHGNDYELIFTEIKTYDPNFYAYAQDFEDFMGMNMGKRCECGAKFSGFKWDHMFYCDLWEPWSKI